jgi:hypothetical protein
VDLKEAITRKYGPLQAWQWGAAAGVIALFFLWNQKKKSAVSADDIDNPSSAGGPRSGAEGEFQSQQSQTEIDPKTGKQIQSSYSATGPLTGGWGGGVGLPMGYPMPYSGGDVYVNLPGDTQNLAGARPATYPPATGPGVSPGHVGGYWWAPQSPEDVAWLGMKAYGLTPPATVEGQQAARAAMNYARILDANPQVNWAAVKDVNSLIGIPIYVPQGSAGRPDTITKMPAGATLNAPSGYSPPTQQTSVSGTA